jgi:hypothetical protein
MLAVYRALGRVGAILDLFLCGCQGASHDVTVVPGDGRETIPPRIEIVASRDNDEHVLPSLVRVCIAATDNSNITELHLRATEMTSGKLINAVHRYPLEKSACIRDAFPVERGVSYQVWVMACDASQNIGVKSICVDNAGGLTVSD